MEKGFKKELSAHLRIALNAILREYSVDLDQQGKISIAGVDVGLNVRYDGGVYRVLHNGQELCCASGPAAVKSYVITHFALRRESERCQH